MDAQIRRRRKVKTIVVWGAALLAVIFGYFVIKGVSVLTRLMTVTGLTPSLVFSLVFDGGATLKSTDGKTNILLLGVGGGTHAGNDLTDTMMVASLDTTRRNTALISIPRDVWSETLKDKVNSAYHYGEEKKVGGGMVLAKVVAEDVVGIPIHYAMRVDFSGFKNIIDELGGIEVNVQRAFTDNDYPIDGKENDTCPGDPTNRCVYETIHFEAGVQHMDGQTALKYARSRHADGEEGTDFARSNRQQDIMIALKTKLMSLNSWFTKDRAVAVWQVADETIDTDLTIGELATIAKLFAVTRDMGIKKISIETMLFAPPEARYGRYVLVPKEDWNAIHEYISGALR